MTLTRLEPNYVTEKDFYSLTAATNDNQYKVQFNNVQ